MSWYKLHWCWFCGIAIRECWMGICQLIQICLSQLVQLKGLTPNAVFGTGSLYIAVLVGKCLGNMETCFLQY